MGFANLHLHTYFSDGLISPADLAKDVLNETGLDLIPQTGGVRNVAIGIQCRYRGRRLIP